MRIAIIGGGVSGLATAWFLQHEHEVTLYERDPWLGGHARTFPVSVGGHTVYAETGPRFYFDISYPYFLALLRLLGVPLAWRDARITFTPWHKPRTLVLPPWSPTMISRVPDASASSGDCSSPPLSARAGPRRALLPDRPAFWR